MVNKKQRSWEVSTIKKIADNRRLTDLGIPTELPLNDASNFQVYKYSPNRKLDYEQEFLVAGPEWSVMQQISLLQNTHDIIGRRLGFTIDFEEWFKAFEYEFMRDLPSGARLPEGHEKPWGKDAENRPKKLNLLKKDEAAKRGYMIVRFWPDRKAESDSIILAGTYNELRYQMLRIMRPEAGESEVYGVPCTSFQESHKFVPQILLYFVEDLEDVEENFQPLDGRISFRLVGETSESLTETKAKTYADRVKAQLGQDGGFEWRKGKTRISYSDKENGIHTWINCRDLAAGRDVLTKVLAISNLTLNEAHLNVRENQKPTEAYPTIPPEKRIYGEQRKLPRKMPVGDVRFQRAELHIWGRPTPIVLISRFGLSRKALVTF